MLPIASIQCSLHFLPLVHNLSIATTIRRIFYETSHDILLDKIAPEHFSHRLLAVLIDLLQHPRDLLKAHVCRRPDGSQRLECAGAHADLLAQVLVRGHDGQRRPQGEVDDGGEGECADEEVGVSDQRHGQADELADVGCGLRRLDRVDVLG